MTNSTLTYKLTYNEYNYSQKISGKTFIDPNGNIVDCSYVTVTISTSDNFMKFYGTAVKDGKDYGFIDDVLIDIQGNNPTGVKVKEITSGKASTNYSFDITTSSLLDGDGLYRIGLYVQWEDGSWNYEYIFITTESDGSHLDFLTDSGENLQVTVKTN